jgi:hypothetical protein
LALSVEERDGRSYREQQAAPLRASASARRQTDFAGEYAIAVFMECLSGLGLLLDRERHLRDGSGNAVRMRLEGNWPFPPPAVGAQLACARPTRGAEGDGAERAGRRTGLVRAEPPALAACLPP